MIVYTAIFGDKDTLLPPKVYIKEGINFFCFTDNRDLKAEGWKLIVKDDPVFEDSRMAAKWYKMHPHSLFPNENTLWIDGNYVITREPDRLFGNFTDLLLIHHDERTCLFEEAQVCLERNAGNPKHIARQIKSYARQGMPRNYGLFRGNILMSKRTPATEKFFEFWWNQVIKYSVRDQISLPYSLWKTGINTVKVKDIKESPAKKSGPHKYHGSVQYKIAPVGRGYEINTAIVEHINEILQEGATILELGSGYGTSILCSKYKVYSVEDDSKWVGYEPKAHYIHAPLKPIKSSKKFPQTLEWYDPEVLERDLKGLTYDLILIDGPAGSLARGGFWKYRHLFNLNIPIIIDDTNRSCEWSLCCNLAKELNIEKLTTFDINKDKAYTVIRRG